MSILKKKKTISPITITITVPHVLGQQTVQGCQGGVVPVVNVPCQAHLKTIHQFGRLSGRFFPLFKGCRGEGECQNRIITFPDRPL